MADMDTYDGEPRGYEGKHYKATPGGYYGHSEIPPDSIQYHYDLYNILTYASLMLILDCCRRSGLWT